MLRKEYITLFGWFLLLFSLFSWKVNFLIVIIIGIVLFILFIYAYSDNLKDIEVYNIALLKFGNQEYKDAERLYVKAKLRKDVARLNLELAQCYLMQEELGRNCFRFEIEEFFRKLKRGEVFPWSEREMERAAYQLIFIHFFEQEEFEEAQRVREYIGTNSLGQIDKKNKFLLAEVQEKLTEALCVLDEAPDTGIALF